MTRHIPWVGQHALLAQNPPVAAVLQPPFGYQHLLHACMYVFSYGRSLKRCEQQYRNAKSLVAAINVCQTCPHAQTHLDHACSPTQLQDLLPLLIARYTRASQAIARL